MCLTSHFLSITIQHPNIEDFYLMSSKQLPLQKGVGRKGKKTILKCFILPQGNMEFPALFSACPVRYRQNSHGVQSFKTIFSLLFHC